MSVECARLNATKNTQSAPIAKSPIFHVVSQTRANESIIPKGCMYFISSGESRYLLSLWHPSINDVELLGSRLGKIEDVLARCLSVMEASTSTQAHSTSTASRNNRHESSHMELSDDLMHESDHSDEEHAVKLQSDRYYVFVGEHGYERFYGLSSMFTLYAEAQTACGQLMTSLSTYHGDEAIQSSVSALRSRLEEASELFQMMAQESPSVLEPNLGDLAPSIPPRALMEVFLDTYVSDLCPLLPIFDPRSVQAAIEEQYAPDMETPDLAWITSFNHILLQTLAAKLGASRKSGLMRGGSLEDGLLSNLLLNAERCYNNFEKLLRPRVANVQALLSLVSPLAFDRPSRLGVLTLSLYRL